MKERNSVYTIDLFLLNNGYVREILCGIFSDSVV
jgi:hypothetical protein